jgi:hypothetical protein
VAATRRELQVRSCFGAAAMLPEDACLRPFHRPRGLDTAFAARDFGDRACLQNSDVTVPVFCRLGTKGRPLRTIVVVGNSHAWRLGPALDVYGRTHRWRVLLAAHVDCLGLASRPAGNVPPGSPCLRWSGALQRHLLGLRHLDGVIFVSHDSARKFLAGTNPTAAAVSDAGRQVLAAWNALTERGVRVFVTEDVPGLRPDNAPECIAMSAADDDPCSRPRSGLLHDNLLTNLAKAHPDLARYVPTDQYFCDAHRCHALVGGVIVYFDSHHLTDTYSRSLGPYLGAQIAAALPH